MSEKKLQKDRIDHINQKIKEHESLVKLIIAIIGIFATIVAAFLGAYLAISGSENLWHKQIEQQNKNEQKFLAKEFLSDIAFIEYSESNFEDYIYNPNSSFNDPKSSRYYHKTIWWQDPIYPQWGIYYSNKQDIAKFKGNLSNKLVSFYAMVLTAEFQRDQYNNYDKIFYRDQNDPFLEQNREQNLLRIFRNMQDNINQSRSQISELKKELQNVSDS